MPAAVSRSLTEICGAPLPRLVENVCRAFAPALQLAQRRTAALTQKDNSLSENWCGSCGADLVVEALQTFMPSKFILRPDDNLQARQLRIQRMHRPGEKVL